MLGDILEPPCDADAIFGPYGLEEFILVAAADHAASGDWQFPPMADVTVGVGLAVRILVGFAYKGGRGDHPRIARRSRVLIVEVEPIVIAEREREITDRSASDFLGRGVAELAPDPFLKFLGQQG